jgi:signal transduction histidine kinase
MTILNAVRRGEPGESAVPTVGQTALWLTAYVLASLVGRIIIVQPHSVGLVWPAAGVAFVWLACTTGRRWFLDIALLCLATVTVLLVTDGGVVRSLLSVWVVLQAALAVWLVRRWVPGIWGAGGRVPLTRLSELGGVLVAVTLAAFTVALVRTLVGLVVIPDELFSLFGGRWGRNAAAMATIGVFGLLLGGWLAQHRDQQRPVLGPVTRSDALHAAGIVAATTLVFVVGFWRNPEAPTTFMLSVTAVWAGIRFNAVVAAGHSLLTGAAAVWLTILGAGPIANSGDAEAQALVAQVFVVVLMIISMTIALTRRQFFDTIASLERSEATLAVRADELDLVMSHLDDGVAIIEEGGRVVHANLALRTTFGSQPVNHTNRLPDPDDPLTGGIYTPDGHRVPWERTPYMRALAGEVLDSEEFHHPEPDGSVRVLGISAFLVPTPEGAPRRVMVVIRDITSATTHRESLASFAGTVAHDLNNPLSVIDGWAEALEEDLTASSSDDAIRAMPMVRRIRSSVGQARAFITDLLAHSAARDQALDCEQIPLATLVKHIASTRDRPRTGGEVVVGDLPDVWADRVLLRQVLDNLIGNAFKYVAPGTVPRVVIDAERAGDGWTRILVHDNGIGVPFLQRERIFESFHRASDDYQGTGLGLAICKRIIQRHGGTIRVSADSTVSPDGGSCFEFTLPMTEQAFAGAVAR